MKIKVKVNFDSKSILAKKGLGSSNRVQKKLASEVKRQSDPYTPLQQGILKNTATIAPDGSQIVYPGPYARYQWEGLVYGPNIETKDGWRSMAPKGGKKPTGKAIAYSGAPTRGKRWTERMWIDKKQEIICEILKEMTKGGK